MKKLSEVYSDLIGRPRESMSAIERAVDRVHYFAYNFVCGGWLYNLSPVEGTGNQWTELRLTANALGIVGATAVQQAIAEVVAIVERADVQSPGTWSEFLSRADPSGRIKELERALGPEVDALWGKLDEYTLTHFECERD